MSIYVIRYGLHPPIENEAIVRSQLRAAHEYRNTLVAIERGRRHAIRAIDDASSEVQEAVEIVKAATKSTRKAAVAKLRVVRRAARDVARDELTLISEREHEILLAARADTKCYWGSYLAIEAAHRQSRQQPLYGDDAVTPNDPAFVRGSRWRDALAPDDPRFDWWLCPGQIGVQLQGGLSVPDLFAGTDTRARLVRDGSGLGAMLWLRVGSNGRNPVWAKWPLRLARELPDAGMIKWIRVSVCPEAHSEHWSCEITLDDPGRDRIRELARPKDHSVAAVEWSWTPLDDGSIHVATYADATGRHDVVFSVYDAEGIRRASKMRSLIDVMFARLCEDFARTVKETKEALPMYVREAANTMHLWRSPKRAVVLLMRWRRDGGSGNAMDILDRWYGGRLLREPVHRCMRKPCPAWHGHHHLVAYADGMRGQTLRRRREFYRVLVARWRAQYSTMILSDQDLSFAARFGDDSDVRFVAGVSELRTAIRNAFGDDAIDARWRDGADEDDDRAWCERSRDAWISGGARGDGRFAETRAKQSNAWQSRKAKKHVNGNELETARNPSANAVQ